MFFKLKSMEYNELFARTELLLGSETMREVASKSVILFGVGGVGSWCAEGLIRSGITRLTIVDSDKVAVANINRQLPATTKTVGMLKVEVLRNRLIEINPNAQITSIPHIYCPESAESFSTWQIRLCNRCDRLTSNKLDLLQSPATNASILLWSRIEIRSPKIRVAEFKKYEAASCLCP